MNDDVFQAVREGIEGLLGRSIRSEGGTADDFLSLSDQDIEELLHIHRKLVNGTYCIWFLRFKVKGPPSLDSVMGFYQHTCVEMRDPRDWNS